MHHHEAMADGIKRIRAAMPTRPRRHPKACGPWSEERWIQRMRK